MKKAALICVTRNNAEKLQTTLNSIIQNTKAEDYDLIIIDNASSDATLGIYQQSVLADHITIVRSGKNLNWVGGINLGVEMTRGYQYVGFLNDDIEVCPNWLENFFDVLDCNPDVAAVGPLTSNTRDWQGYDNVRSIFSDWKLPELQKIDRKEVFMMYEHLKNSGSGIKLKGTISFFCILLKRSLVDQIGLLHPEFIEKLRLAGYCFALSARTYVSHDYNAFSWQCKLFQNSYYSRSFINKTWVINLERRRDRLDRFKRDNPGLPELHVLKAYDGKKIRLSPKIASLFSPNTFNWNKATIGCSLSHLEIWNRLSKEPDENASYLILEDDTRLSPDWRETVEPTFANGQVPDDWDVLYLGGVLPKHENNFIQCKEIVSGNIFRVAPNNFWFWQEIPDRYFHFGAYAYFLSRKGAIKLLEIIMLNQGISLQADFLLAYPAELKRYFFDPFLAHCYQDIEAGFKKSYSEESHREGILDSDIWQVSDCFEESTAKAMVSMSEPYDICGALEEARKQMQVPSNTKNVKTSLLPECSAAGSGISKIWLINLERRRDRLEKFKSNYPEFFEEVYILKAYDGARLCLTPKIARLFAPNNFAWNKATMGCSLSHLDLWYRLANEPDENASYLILEDDTKLSPSWREIVELAFSNGDVPSDWDVVYLGGVLPKNESAFAGVKEKVSGKIFQVAPNEWAGQNPPNRYFHFGAYAYILSHKGARNLLHYISITNGIWQQADFDLGYVFPPTYPVQLKHYFFDPFLAHCYQDIEAGFKKSYSEESHREGILDSDIWQVSDCFEESTAKAMVSMSEPYDICGALEEARKQMQVPSNKQNIKISLLHATRSRPIQALNAKELWLNKAKFPGRVEHLFAIDHDDAESISLEQHAHVVQLKNGYSVGAWNLAASKCTGDVLIQLSDDWLPPDGWDELIVTRLNPDCEEVLWVSDGNRTDDLMCMAITTRKYYLRHGLFDPVFKNVYSDNDFTLRAKKAGAVVDARDIKIKHDHPSIGTGKTMDATYERGNKIDEYERAKAIFEAKHFPTIYSQNDESGNPAWM